MVVCLTPISSTNALVTQWSGVGLMLMSETMYRILWVRLMTTVIAAVASLRQGNDVWGNTSYDCDLDARVETIIWRGCSWCWNRFWEPRLHRSMGKWFPHWSMPFPSPPLQHPRTSFWPSATGWGRCIATATVPSSKRTQNLKISSTRASKLRQYWSVLSRRHSLAYGYFNSEMLL